MNSLCPNYMLEFPYPYINGIEQKKKEHMRCVSPHQHHLN